MLWGSSSPRGLPPRALGNRAPLPPHSWLTPTCLIPPLAPHRCPSSPSQGHRCPCPREGGFQSVNPDTHGAAGAAGHGDTPHAAAPQAQRSGAESRRSGAEGRRGSAGGRPPGGPPAPCTVRRGAAARPRTPTRHHSLHAPRADVYPASDCHLTPHRHPHPSLPHAPHGHVPPTPGSVSFQVVPHFPSVNHPQLSPHAVSHPQHRTHAEDAPLHGHVLRLHAPRIAPCTGVVPPHPILQGAPS